MLWPTYALRAWMTALLGQMERTRDDLGARVEAHEKELARLRAQKERSSIVITALREALGSVDHVLRRMRDAGTQTDQERARRQDEALQEKEELKRAAHEKHPSVRSKS
jgi:hypothetical protein